MIEFKSANECFSDLKSDIQTEVPEFTKWSRGNVVRSIIWAASRAMGLLWTALKTLYYEIWPQYASKEGLRRHYEEWGLIWDNPDLETARNTVLGYYRKHGTGTKPWYQEVVLETFSDYVTEVIVELKKRGPNTVDITVSYHHNPVGEDYLEEIRDFFATDDYNVGGADVQVSTVEEATGVAI